MNQGGITVIYRPFSLFAGMRGVFCFEVRK